MSSSKIATMKFFSLNSMVFLTFSQIFSINFGLLGALSSPRQTPPGALYTPLVTEPTLLSPSETNCWLRPCRLHWQKQEVVYLSCSASIRISQSVGVQLIN